MYQPDLPDTSSSPTISTNLNWNQCATIPPHMLFDYQLTNQTSLVKWLYQLPLTIAIWDDKPIIQQPYLFETTSLQTIPIQEYQPTINQPCICLKQPIHQLYLSEANSSPTVPIWDNKLINPAHRENQLCIWDNQLKNQTYRRWRWKATEQQSFLLSKGGHVQLLPISKRLYLQ